MLKEVYLMFENAYIPRA